MTTQEDCVHHWKIESPNGNAGWSTGKCIRCKAEKGFNNIIEESHSPWTKQKPKVES